MTRSFVGAGWAHPARIDATGSFALVTQEREIEESIRIIVATYPGERPMRPEFGCRIHDYVFAPMTSTTAGEMVYEVRIALERWEPRIDVDDVLVGFDHEREGTIYVDVRYRIKDMNDPRNLVFPFYVIPDELPAAAPALLTTGRGD